MRSRYSAFFTDNIPYLKLTWHPDTYPEDLAAGEAGRWVGLEILDSFVDELEGEGEVEFRARFLLGNKLEILHERSDFEKIEGRWVYHSGEFLNEGENLSKVAPGDPCPCQSGLPFKDCHRALR
jgi:SEC-C motif-containing protein